jgi:alcohol dehydrogenase
MLLPSVVRWNGPVAAERYGELLNISSAGSGGTDPAERLAQRLEQLTLAGGLHRTLSAAGVHQSDLSMLAGEAAEQWTGLFNPRPFDKAGATEVYQSAF